MFAGVAISPTRHLSHHGTAAFTTLAHDAEEVGNLSEVTDRASIPPEWSGVGRQASMSDVGGPR